MMGTAEVFEIVGGFVVVTGAIIVAITGNIAYRYRGEIKQAELRRAFRLRPHHANATVGAPHSKEVEILTEVRQ